MHADPEFAGLGWAEVLDLTSLTQEEESGQDGPQGTCRIHVHVALGHSPVSAPCQARAGRHGAVLESVHESECLRLGEQPRTVGIRQSEKRRVRETKSEAVRAFGPAAGYCT